MSITDHVEGIVHEPTQVHEDGRAIDLTVAEVFEVVEPGRVDFGGEPSEVLASEARQGSGDERSESDGGGELEPADLAPHDRVWRNEDDDYQWWHLDSGQYVLAFNEAVAADERLVLQPRDVVLQRGASHPTLHTRSVERVPLSVGRGGLRLKENARVSTLLVP